VSVDEQPRSSTMRCSSVTRQMDVRPTATAGSFEAVLTLDWPLPWRADASDHLDLEPIVTHLRSGRDVPGPTRLQLLVPERSAEVTLYRRPRGPFVAYERLRSDGDAATTVERAVALLDTRHSASPGAAETKMISEILVCTHGKRDVCCGSLGPAVHRDLSQIYAGSSAVRVRRTSHLGGHRFAPTVALMPIGTVWAWVDADLVCGIVEQSIPIDRAARHFRGSMGMDGPEVQALDAALLAEFGWSWLGRARTGVVVARDGVEAQVEIHHATAEERWATTATVVVDRTSPVPGCGVPIDGTEKTQPEWTVSGLTTTRTS
jgi:hypothetical protein